MWCVAIAVLVGQTYYAAAAQSCHSAANTYPSEEQVEAARSRRLAFDAKDEGEWTGAYYSTDSMTSGTDFSWSPASGFVVWSEGCYPVPSNASYGAASFDGRRLVLAPEVPLGKRSSFGVAESYVAVKWGERHYLVPEDKLREFCFDVNAFGPEIYSFLIKAGDAKRPAIGKPDVPPEAAGFLLDRPIKAKVRSAAPSGTDRIVVEIDKGEADGILVGMKLGGTRRDDSITVRVVATERETSQAILDGYLIRADSGPFELTARELMGWRLSTRYAPLDY